MVSETLQNCSSFPITMALPTNTHPQLASLVRTQTQPSRRNSLQCSGSIQEIDHRCLSVETGHPHERVLWGNKMGSSSPTASHKPPRAPSCEVHSPVLLPPYTREVSVWSHRQHHSPQLHKPLRRHGIQGNLGSCSEYMEWLHRSWDFPCTCTSPQGPNNPNEHYQQETHLQMALQMRLSIHRCICHNRQPEKSNILLQKNCGLTWKHKQLFLFPPLPLVTRVVLKRMREKLSSIFVTPWRP